MRSQPFIMILLAVLVLGLVGPMAVAQDTENPDCLYLGL